MISDTALDSLWRDFDPYQDHEIGNDLCAECIYPTKMCHKCGNILHNSEYEGFTESDESVLMTEWLCEECGYNHREESQWKVR